MKIGIDIGGSHIAVGLINENGNILYKKEKELNTKDKINVKKTLVDIIVKYISEILKENNIPLSEIELIGIASPGTIKNNVIIKATNLGLENFDIISELRKHFDVNYIIKNDAKSSTLAEKEYGSMKDYTDFVYICLGTGIGCGVVMNNKLIQPKRYEGFELGHITIEVDGKMCTCGKRGCWEQYASMKNFRKSLINTLKLEREPNSYELLEIVRNSKNDEEINQIVDKYITYLVVGIENIINIFEPEAICIGGSFDYYKDVLLEKLIKKLEQRNATYNNEKLPVILCAEFKNDAGIIGSTIEK